LLISHKKYFITFKVIDNLENMVLRIWELVCESCDGWFSESPYEKRAVRCVQVDISSVRRNWNGQWSRTTL